MNRLLGMLVATLLCCMLAPGTEAASSDFEAELASIQQAWAVANYGSGDAAARKRAFETLSARAHEFSAANPERAEALIWEGIVLSTYAGVKGGLGALGLAKKSRAVLEASLKIDADALAGSAYTSLGALYGKVPGFPLGFGNDETARKYLLKALEINPMGIDTNYFYADFLVDEKQYEQARVYLQKALSAPPRPGRELADQGRRKDIDALLKRIDAQVR
jgi:tetratricopeptide (TPR) repeat protein